MRSDISSGPCLAEFEVPMDSWTQPFWEATATGTLLLPRCGDCTHFRWPPGPFCPRCRSQRVEWRPSGRGQIYSFTIITGTANETGERPIYVPALIEFPDAGGVRLMAAVVNTSLSAIRIGAAASLGWSQAANAKIPVFSIEAEREGT